MTPAHALQDCVPGDDLSLAGLPALQSTWLFQHEELVCPIGGASVAKQSIVRLAEACCTLAWQRFLLHRCQHMVRGLSLGAQPMQLCLKTVHSALSKRA